MRIATTPCCAMSVLAGLSNKTTKGELEDLIEKKFKEREEVVPRGERIGFGETLLLAVTTPEEEKLEEVLHNAGFINLYDFERRTGYPEGLLTLWALPIDR